MIEAFAPIKVIFNDLILYNDYDSDIEVEPGVFGENKPLAEAFHNRLWQAENYVVTNINISIVQYHHSIVTLRGKYAYKET